MKRVLLAFSLIFCLVAASCSGGSGRPSSSSVSSPPHLIASFSGNNSKTTARFTTTKSAWYLEYDCQYADKDIDAMVWMATVLPMNEPSDSSNFICALNTSTPGIDTSYVYGHKGTFYLNVISTFANWTIDIYE
jgi:hypothetical protein